MSNSLRDELMGLGFKAPAPEPRRERPARDTREGGKPGARAHWRAMSSVRRRARTTSPSSMPAR